MSTFKAETLRLASPIRPHYLVLWFKEWSFKHLHGLLNTLSYVYIFYSKSRENKVNLWSQDFPSSLQHPIFYFIFLILPCTASYILLLLSILSLFPSMFCYLYELQKATVGFSFPTDYRIYDIQVDFLEQVFILTAYKTFYIHLQSLLYISSESNWYSFTFS